MEVPLVESDEGKFPYMLSVLDQPLEERIYDFSVRSGYNSD